MQINSQKYIKQYTVNATNHQYSFEKISNPYQSLEVINQTVQKKYDCEVIAIHSQTKYSKNKINMKKSEDFKIDYKYNNLFPSQNNNLNDIFKENIPLNFSNRLKQQKKQNYKIKLQKKQINDIEKNLNLIMEKYKQQNKTKLKSFQTIRLENLKSIDEQMVIFVEILLNKEIQIKIESDRKQFLTASLNNIYINFYLNPTPQSKKSLEKYQVQPSKIINWSIGCDFKAQTYHYFEIDRLNQAIQKENQQKISIQNFIDIQYKNHKASAIVIYSQLFNNISLQIKIKMQQIKKYRKFIQKNNNNQQKIIEYYLDLTYPPIYQITQIDEYTASRDMYKKKWKRVENFLFLRNRDIAKNDFLRLYLFNHSIFKITLIQDIYESQKIDSSMKKMQKLLNKVKNKMNYEDSLNSINFQSQIGELNNKFAFGQFKDKLRINQPTKLRQIWKLKYFLLLMIQKDYLDPFQVLQILDDVQNHMQYLQIYIFNLQQISTNFSSTINGQKSLKELIMRSKQKIEKNKLNSLITKSFQNTELIVYTFRLRLTPSGYLYEAPTPEMNGRLLRHYSQKSDYFLRVNLTDDNEIKIKNQNYITRGQFRQMLDQIVLIDRKYIPLGWSPSQLRAFSIWYISEDQQIKPFLTLPLVLSFLGDFSQIDVPAKKAARIGQSFSASWNYEAKNIQEVQISDIISEKGFMFTDGIGKISQNLMEEISLKCGIKNISVIQIRYKGIKGLLALDKTLPQNSIIIRRSMIKYKCPHPSAQKYLDILDWNKYKAGFLNRQIIILLRTLGIQDKIFMQLQQNHIKQIAQQTYKDCSIFKQLNNDLNTQLNNLQPANKIILQLVKAGFMLQQQPFFKGMLEIMKKNGYFQLKEKSNLFIPQSARILGISDEYKILEENEVYCQIYNEYSLNSKRQTIEGDVIVTRNPCLDPADIRKLRCVGKDEIQRRFKDKGYDGNQFHQYINCVIFPQKGQIPITAQISGSDLDGDCFFISWDPCLIPVHHFVANIIDQPKMMRKEGEQKQEVSYEQMLDFFIDYLNYEKLGQIDNSHLVHADLDLSNYASNKKCMSLAKIHGKAVDFPKTGKCPPIPSELLTQQFPDFMQKDDKISYKSQSILGKLYTDIKERIKDLININCLAQEGTIDQDLIQLYIRNDYEPYSKNQISQTIDILIEFERQLSNIIALINVETQYEIYSGNFSTVKNNVKVVGINRLISIILNFRFTFKKLFFYDLSIEDREKYEKVEKLEKIIFERKTYRKTILYYLVSYMFHFPNLKIVNQEFITFEKDVRQCLQSMQKKESDYLGFIWFIIPKIIINLKYLGRKQVDQSLDEEQII